jgi:hypothetical protein
LQFKLGLCSFVSSPFSGLDGKLDFIKVMAKKCRTKHSRCTQDQNSIGLTLTRRYFQTGAIFTRFSRAGGREKLP